MSKVTMIVAVGFGFVLGGAVVYGAMTAGSYLSRCNPDTTVGALQAASKELDNLAAAVPRLQAALSDAEGRLKVSTEKAKKYDALREALKAHIE
jgi:hypothetical protein